MTQVHLLPPAFAGPSWEVCFKYGLTARQAAALRGCTTKAARVWAQRHGLTWPGEGEEPRLAGDGGHAPRVDADDLEPLPPILPEDLDLKSCRRIWCAVLLSEWRAVFLADRPRGGVAPIRGRRGRAGHPDMAALRWFGSRDFHMVCALAGFDGMAVLDRFQALCRARGIVA